MTCRCHTFTPNTGHPRREGHNQYAPGGSTPLRILDTIDDHDGTVTLKELPALVDDKSEAAVLRAYYRLVESGELVTANGYVRRTT